MSIDLHAKAAQLLESLANAIYDRDTKTSQDFFSFRTTDLHIVEKWLKDTLNEAFNYSGEY